MCINQQILDATNAMARFWDTPNIYIVRLAISKNIPDFFALHQSGCRSADVTRLDAILFSLCQIDLYLDLRNLRLQLHMQINQAIHLGKCLFYLICLLMNPSQIGPVDSDHNTFARAGKNLLDSFIEVGFYIMKEPRIPVYHFFDGC